MTIKIAIVLSIIVLRRYTAEISQHYKKEIMTKLQQQRQLIA